MSSPAPMSFRPDPSPTAAPIGGRWLRRCRRWSAPVLILASRVVLVLLVLAFLGILALHTLILPRLPEYREQIARDISLALGVKVEIGQVRTRAQGWIPSVTLEQVTLHDPQGRPALTLPEIDATLSLKSLAHWPIQPRQIVIKHPDLDIRRDAQGKVWIAGIPIEGHAKGGDPASARTAADWFLGLPEFVIEKGRVQWTDELLKTPTLALSDLDLVMRNRRGVTQMRHEWRLDGTPPKEWGDRFSWRSQMTAPSWLRPSELQRWSGQSYIELPRGDVQRLRQYVKLPVHVQSGHGALRWWTQWRDGQWIESTTDLQLADVSLRLGKDLAPLDVTHLQGRLEWLDDGEQQGFAARQVSFRTAEGWAWPKGDVEARWRLSAPMAAAQVQDAASQAASVAGLPWHRIRDGQFKADALDLALLARLGERVPLSRPVRALLEDLKPQGVIRGLHGQWTGSPDAPSRYELHTAIDDLSVDSEPAHQDPRHPVAGRPGIRHASATLDATERGGSASFAIKDGHLDLPGVFEVPLIPVDELDARLKWNIKTGGRGLPPDVEVKLESLKVRNADVAGEIQGSWRSGASQGVGAGMRFPGLIDLRGQLSRIEARQVWRYLPLGVAPQARDYVRLAIQGGQGENLQFKLKGDLWDFPFAKPGTGEFLVKVQMKDLMLSYVPDMAGGPSLWPAFQQIQGELVFERQGMKIRNATGKLYGLDLLHIQARIPDLDHHPELQITGQIRGPLADALKYVSSSPIGGWLGHGLDQATATGNAELKLGLQIPLDHSVDTKVQGSLQLQGNDLRILPSTPLLGNARGTLDFNETGFTLKPSTAKVLGGEATFYGASTRDLALGTVQRFNGQGSITAEGLRQATEMGWLARLAHALDGQAGYQLSLQIAGNQTELSIQSSLQGLRSQLPYPLAKPADQAMPLRYSTLLEPDRLRRPGLAPRDTLRLDMGDALHIRFHREHADDGQTRVISGGIGLFEPAPSNETGVSLLATLPQVDVDHWQRAIMDILVGPDGGHSQSDDGSAYMPSQMTLRTQDLELNGRHLQNVVAGVTRDGGLWRGNVNADQLAGRFEYRDPQSGGGSGGRVYARLSRLSIPAHAADSVNELLDQQPSTVPALDIVVDDLELRGRRLGRLEVEAVNQSSGEQREWQLKRFDILNPDAKLSAKGRWAGEGGRAKRTALDFQLQLQDSGALLARMGMPDTLSGGNGLVLGKLEWQGSPLGVDAASLSGSLDVALDKGQFLKADPGAARFLSVLSLQALPRRLTLDFRDVFSDGFAFDNIQGHVQMKQGVASTQGLKIKGVAAMVLMEGQANVAKETQDLHVVVVPEINAGTASLAYTAVNPAIGLSTFLAQLFLRKPLQEAGTREFHISGSWTDPKVEALKGRSKAANDEGVDTPASGPQRPRPRP